MRKIALASVAMGILCTVTAAPADDAPADASKAALGRLRALAGEWTGEVQGQPIAVRYRVIGNGSAVVEELFPGTDHEMLTVYHLDGDDLRLTHYCAARNQPRMKLDRAKSKPDDLVFAFDGGYNIDPEKDAHMHSGRIQFLDADHILAEWAGYAAGKPGHVARFDMKRKKP